MSASANAQQETYWTTVGGPNWVSKQREFDQMLAAFGAEAIARLAPQPGERIVDIGCGTGTTSGELAAAVTVSGHVVGVDISAPMVTAASAGAVGTPQLSFRLVDAQTEPLSADGELFDAVFSRMGVMFFADPVAAFANIAASVRPGGRLAFACWRNEQFNPWINEPALILRRHTPELVYPPANAPGPFGFQDGDRVRSILAESGWVDVAVEAFDSEVAMGGGLGVEPALAQTMATTIGQILRQQVDDATYEVAANDVRALMQRHLVDGAVVFPASTWIVTASRSV